MTATAELLREIKAGARTLGISPRTLCKNAVRNGQLVDRLEGGGTATLETATKIRSYITEKKRAAK